MMPFLCLFSAVLQQVLPIEAIEDQSSRLDVPSSMLGTGDYYALEVAGDLYD